MTEDEKRAALDTTFVTMGHLMKTGKLIVKTLGERMTAIEDKQRELVKAMMQTEMFSLRITQLNKKLDEQSHTIEMLKTKISD